MTIFFDLDVVKRFSKGDVSKYIDILSRHAAGKLQPQYVTKPIYGKSFLLNPLPLFKDKQTDILFKIQYIELAARRDYNLYKLYNHKALDISFYPELNIGRIQNNPLLKLNSNQLHFKHEE